VIDGPDYEEALADLQLLTPRPRLARPADALEAILAVQALVPPGAAVEQVHSSIDLDLQRLVTTIARRRLAEFAAQGAGQVAVLVVDRPSMAVLAMVGSGSYSAVNDGEVDYTRVMRSPGSTLKPFIFAQALDRGTIAPDSVLLDGPDSGTLVENADRRYLGDMLAPQALGNSRNVPAAALVRRNGLHETEAFMATLGLHDADEGQRFGLSIAIGALPTSLRRLVAAYGALANDGVLKPLNWYDGQALPPQAPVLSIATARTVTLFLSDPMARLPSFARMGAVEFPFPVAVKTGTSQDYRDAWVVDYTADYVVGVWVGRPDGGGMDGLMGANSAAVIGHDILSALYPQDADGEADTSFAAPPGSRPVTVCADTGTLAGADCATRMAAYLPADMAVLAAPVVPTPGPLRIVSPLNHADFILNPDAPPGLAVLPLRIAPGSGAGTVEWFVDGAPFQAALPGSTVNWPATPGRHEFVVEDAAGRHAAPVEVLVQ
jgi:penicillin-binding protein 1C